jgi:arylformamidase
MIQRVTSMILDIGMSEPVFNGYDAKEFERQYNARLLVPDSEAITEGFGTASEALRARHSTKHLDLPYGSSGRERLDVFPAAAQRSPVVIYIHGGYWRSRDKSLYSFLAEPINALGATAVLTGYSLCPHVTIDAIVRQTRAACAWVWNNIDEYGGDHHRIHVVGNSAGGHLAAMLAATQWPEVDHARPADLLKGAMSLSGLFELSPLLVHSINETINLDQASVKRNSPILKKPTVAGPFISAVGGDESAEFIRQSRELAQTWKEHNNQVEFVEVAGRNHFSIVGDFTQPDYVLLRKLKAMMKL